MSDMLVKLYELPPLAPLVEAQAAQGIRIVRALGTNKRQIVEWVQTHFGDMWANETDIAFSRTPVSCYLAIDDKTIVGFGVHDATMKNFFGPTGVLDSHRGRGIGKVLLVVCLQAMADAGYAYAIIGGVGPADFYGKAVGATLIPDSSPGIFKNLVGREVW